MNAAQPTSNRDWVGQELGEARLGDARLDRRLPETATRTADRPTAADPRRPDGNEPRGPCRVAHAPRARPRLLQETRRRRTRRRVDACPGRALPVRDTAGLDFTSHPAARHCLGPIGTGGGPGSLQHDGPAFDPEGEQILGLASRQLVEREPQPEGETRGGRARRAGEEPRLRPEGIRGIGLAPRAARWTHVCDRGGDSFEAMQLVRGQQQESPIRVHRDRRVSVASVDEEAEGGRDATRSLRQTIRGTTKATTKVVAVASRGGRPARGVNAQIGPRAAISQPPRPDGARRGPRPLQVTPIRVWEEGVEEARAAPASAEAAAEAAAKAAEAAVAAAEEKEAWDEAQAESAAAKAAAAAAEEEAEAAAARVATHLDRRLGTSGPMEAAADVERAVSDYEWRRPVAEEYHEVEKSGLRIEGQRFESRDPLAAVLAAIAVVAIRVSRLRYARGSHPEASAETIATPEEVGTAGRATKRVGRVLSVKRFVDAVARLGGPSGRKGDGPPGRGTSWRGCQRSKDMLLGAELVREMAGEEDPADEDSPRDPPGSG